MRSLRMSYQQIADQLYKGNKGHCYNDIQKAMDELTREPAEAVRLQEIELLDVMARGLMSRAAKGDEKAIQAMLKIQERRAKYLGLDTPVQLEQLGGGTVSVVFDPALNVTGMAEPELVVDPID
ncbi:hypothetical protein ACMX2H_18335 [Arthrobacter sulfonylureivorans]|uniref:hypothetical protein n=1 Tax=Arthrobacter sulfonylureivorans TaxID=2486855 RepID=UPI0039E461C9